MKMGESDWMRRKVIRWMEDNRGLILTGLKFCRGWKWEAWLDAAEGYQVDGGQLRPHPHRVKILQRMKMGESDWMRRKVIRWMEDNRGLILTLFGLPLSFLFDQALQVPTLYCHGTRIEKKTMFYYCRQNWLHPHPLNTAIKATHPLLSLFFFLLSMWQGRLCLY